MSNTIHETIQGLLQAEDRDASFLIAAQINLYSEALRRRAGRTLWGPSDVQVLLHMINILLTPMDMEQTFIPNRAIRPSETEESAILQATEDAMLASATPAEAAPQAEPEVRSFRRKS